MPNYRTGTMLEMLCIETSEQPNSIPLPDSLTEYNPRDIKHEQEAKFVGVELEMSKMHIELKSEPTIESLEDLYRQQALAREYFERTSEIYRAYTKYASKIGTILKQAQFTYDSMMQTIKLHAQSQPEYARLKTQADRETYTKSFIPEKLSRELLDWQTLSETVKAELNIVKSYNEQFKVAREDILVQLSIVKQLASLGGMKLSSDGTGDLDQFGSTADYVDAVNGGI